MLDLLMVYLYGADRSREYWVLNKLWMDSIDLCGSLQAARKQGTSKIQHSVYSPKLRTVYIRVWAANTVIARHTIPSHQN